MMTMMMIEQLLKYLQINFLQSANRFISNPAL